MNNYKKLKRVEKEFKDFKIETKLKLAELGNEQERLNFKHDTIVKNTKDTDPSIRMFGRLQELDENKTSDNKKFIEEFKKGMEFVETTNSFIEASNNKDFKRYLYKTKLYWLKHKDWLKWTLLLISFLSAMGLFQIDNNVLGILINSLS